MYKPDNKIILLLGGARSGKSSRAQELAAQTGGKVLFCATAQPLDDEMKNRIIAHKNSRPNHWDTVEIPLNIARILEKTAQAYDTVIIDCITLLVSNCLGEDPYGKKAVQAVDDEIAALIDMMKNKQSNYIMVSNEVGSGLIPDNRMGRIYRDVLGQVNQRLAKAADEVYLMAAGLQLRLK